VSVKGALERPLIAWGIMVAMVLAGCSSGTSTVATEPSIEFVGRVSGLDAFVGIVTRGSDVAAYVCDGAGGTISVADWFTGKITRGGFDLELDGGRRLTGTINPDAVIVGILRTSAGDTFVYQAPRARGAARLVRADGTLANVGYTAGWIVLADGEQRGGVQSRGTKPALYPAPPAPSTRVQTLAVPNLGTVAVSSLSDCRPASCPCPPGICRP
jgi:hypothetical protein